MRKMISAEEINSFVELLDEEEKTYGYQIGTMMSFTKHLFVDISFPETATEEEKVAFATKITTTVSARCRLRCPKTGEVTMQSLKVTETAPVLIISIK